MGGKPKGANILKLLIMVFIVGAGGWFTYLKIREHNMQSAVHQEQLAQEPELKMCCDRLTQFSQAWSAYTKDHQGAEPPSIEALIPTYIPHANLLYCPTAERWRRKGAYLDQGTILLNRRKYAVTYGFRCFAAGYPRLVRKTGDRTPLIICTAHQEGLYRAAYHRPPPLGAFSTSERAKLIPALQTARILVVRRNGKVDTLDPDNEY